MPDRLFPPSAPLIVFPDGPVSNRTRLGRLSQLRRLGKMHGRHGHGDGRTCEGCAHLVRKHGHGKSFLKCELYDVKGFEGTDWLAKWSACGAWTRKALTP